MSLWTTCYIGLGSNLANEYGKPTDHLQNAIAAFNDSEHFNNIAVSSLYASKAYGVTDQPDFINGVLKADTCLSPLELLQFCQNLENHAGRIRLRHWGERSLDVDILLYGEKTINYDKLIIPHKEILLRNFVIIPLLEINSELMINNQKLKDLPISNDWQGLKKLVNEI